MNDSGKAPKITLTAGVIVAFALLAVINIGAIIYSVRAMGQLRQYNAELRAGLESLSASLGLLAGENTDVIELYNSLAARLDALVLEAPVPEEIDDGEIALGAAPSETTLPAPTRPASTAPPQTTAPAETTVPLETAPTTQAPETTVPVATTEAADLLAAGERVIVSVYAPSVEDLYGYQFEMHYGAGDLEFAGGLKSHVAGISTIFSNPFEGYRLVGATMIGAVAGYSGEDVLVCEMAFTALQDCDLSQLGLSLGGIRLVDSREGYHKGISGWSVEITRPS